MDPVERVATLDALTVNPTVPPKYGHLAKGFEGAPAHPFEGRANFRSGTEEQGYCSTAVTEANSIAKRLALERASGKAEALLAPAMAEGELYNLQIAIFTVEKMIADGEIPGPPTNLAEAKAMCASCERVPWHTRYRWSAADTPASASPTILNYHGFRRAPPPAPEHRDALPGASGLPAQLELMRGPVSGRGFITELPVKEAWEKTKLDAARERIARLEEASAASGGGSSTQTIVPLGIESGRHHCFVTDEPGRPTPQPLPGSLTLTFTGPDGKEHTLRVEPANTTIAQLRHRITQVTGVTPAPYDPEKGWGNGYRLITHTGQRLYEAPEEEDAPTKAQSDDGAFVIADPSRPGTPIHFVSPGFTSLTGYCTSEQQCETPPKPTTTLAELGICKDSDLTLLI